MGKVFDETTSQWSMNIETKEKISDGITFFIDYFLPGSNTNCHFVFKVISLNKNSSSKVCWCFLRIIIPLIQRKNREKRKGKTFLTHFLGKTFYRCFTSNKVTVSSYGSDKNCDHEAGYGHSYNLSRLTAQHSAKEQNRKENWIENCINTIP